MAGFTTAFARTTLDSAIVNGDKVAWSENGTSQSAHVAATAIAAWDASTNADPALRKNTAAVDSAACDADSITITHFAVYDSAGTTQKTDWTALGSPRTLMTGDKLTIAAQAIVVSLT
jgi:GTP cyclohydrolase III